MYSQSDKQACLDVVHFNLVPMFSALTMYRGRDGDLTQCGHDDRRAKDSGCLIKVNKNVVAIRRAPHTVVRLPKMFAEGPHPNNAATTTAAAIKPERLPQTNIKRETGPTTSTSTVPKVIHVRPQCAGMVYVSVESIQALVQRQVRTKF